MTKQELNQKVINGESFLLAADGSYLGRLTLSKYTSDSISNPYGTYGSKYASASIWNQYGTYGSPYSSFSPFNPYTTTPPMVFLRGRRVGVLSKNQFVAGRIDPDTINNWMAENYLNY